MERGENYEKDSIDITYGSSQSACWPDVQETALRQRVRSAGTEAAETTAAAEDAGETTAGAEDGDGEVSADNPFNGKTVKVGCSSTFVPFESIEMDAKGNKTYVGMNY